MSELTIKVVPFAEWRREISPLWQMEDEIDEISTIIDGYGQVQYGGRERLTQILCYPIVAERDGERIGWTSVFNMSEEAVRIRGIYVLEKHRSGGIGYKMVKYASSLWPLPWKWVYMYAREANVDRYLRWGFHIPPPFKLRTWESQSLDNPPKVVLMRRNMHEEPPPR
jgi:hypothetical protein